MKRYLVFAGSSYYASGGWLDFVADFDTLQPAIDAAKEEVSKNRDDQDWWQVVDSQSGTIMSYKDGVYSGQVTKGAKLEPLCVSVKAPKIRAKLWFPEGQLLRWFQRTDRLQQVWVCHETGEREWKDVPFVRMEDDKPLLPLQPNPLYNKQS